MYVFKNNGGLNFSVTQTVNLGINGNAGPRGVSLTDIDNNGSLDIIATEGVGVAPFAVSILKNNGAGTFDVSQTLPYGAYDNYVGVGDINNDGFVDFALSGYAFLNRGNGSFAATSSIALGAPGAACYDTTLIDLNHDGNLDAVMTLGAAGAFYSYFAVAMGNGDGSFSSVMTTFVAAGARLQEMQMGDVNGDGVPDVLVEDSQTSLTHVFIGNGDGSFRANATYANASQVFTSGDVNNDGVLDFVAAGNVFIGNSRQLFSMQRLDLLTTQSARQSLTIVKDQLSRITQELANIGAAQSRFSSEVSALSARHLETVSAASTIISADIAQESACLLRSQIIQQAASFVLTQANQQPEIALALLRG